MNGILPTLMCPFIDVYLTEEGNLVYIHVKFTVAVVRISMQLHTHIDRSVLLQNVDLCTPYRLNSGLFCFIDSRFSSL